MTSVRAAGHQCEISHLPVRVRARSGGELGVQGFKGHLQPVCIGVVHFTEFICCNTETTEVISVFDNRIVSMFLLRRVSQPAISLGCEDTTRFSKTIRTFVISVLLLLLLLLLLIIIIIIIIILVWTGLRRKLSKTNFYCFSQHGLGTLDGQYYSDWLKLWQVIYLDT